MVWVTACYSHSVIKLDISNTCRWVSVLRSSWSCQTEFIIIIIFIDWFTRSISRDPLIGSDITFLFTWNLEAHIECVSVGPFRITCEVWLFWGILKYHLFFAVLKDFGHFASHRNSDHLDNFGPLKNLRFFVILTNFIGHYIHFGYFAFWSPKKNFWAF